jgi:hypothetical protein
MHLHQIAWLSLKIREIKKRAARPNQFENSKRNFKSMKKLNSNSEAPKKRKKFIEILKS